MKGASRCVTSGRGLHGFCGNGHRWAMMSGWRRMGTVDRASTRGAVLTAAGTVGPTMAGRTVVATSRLLTPQAGEGPLSSKRGDGRRPSADAGDFSPKPTLTSGDQP